MTKNLPPIKELITARLQLLQSIKEFPKDKYDLVFYGDWTIKQVIAHISSWDIYFTQLLSSFIKGKPIDYWGNINAFNSRAVKARQDLTLEQTIEEFNRASQDFINIYQKLPSELLTQKIWPDRSYTPAGILKIQTHHYHSQTKEILKRL